MAERTESRIEIAATRAQVMAVIADFSSYPEWADGVREAEVRKVDAKGRGVLVAMHVSSGFVDARYTLAYEYVPRSGGLSWKTVEASGAVRHLIGEYVLEKVAGGTLVTYRLTMEPAISLPGFLKRTAERAIVDTALGGLKKRVEELAA